MSDLDYDALRKVAEAATPGPWYANPGGYVELDAFGEDEHFNGVADTWNQNEGADANHIATFDPPTVLRLLDLAQRAEADRAAVERVRALADRADSTSHMNGDSFGAVISTDDLRAALDREEDQ